MKGLEAFERIQCNYVHVFKARENGKTQLVYDLNTVKKELQALEILRNKKVNLEYLKCCENYEQYKTVCSYWNEITEQEFDLLRGVLI